LPLADKLITFQEAGASLSVSLPPSLSTAAAPARRRGAAWLLTAQVVMAQLEGIDHGQLAEAARLDGNRHRLTQVAVE
jgi:hypothetical protein